MPEKLQRDHWQQAVRQHRSNRRGSFTEALQQRKQKAETPEPKKGTWVERVRLERTLNQGGGRHRALVGPARSRRYRRPIGGMLRSNSPKSRPQLTERDRQNLPKTGNQVPKVGINATGWSYDHRMTLNQRRSRGETLSKSGKKGINAEGWRYDHRKAVANQKASLARRSRPTTHVPKERKRSSTLSKSSNLRPTRTQQPNSKAPSKQPAKVVTPKRGK